jgi:predicted membrane channel-forming protein YqfA (hemolysin III family)
MNDKEYIQGVQPRRVVRIFFITAIVLGILSFIGQVLRLFPGDYTIHGPLEESFLDMFIYQFGVNTEANIATHFNTLILVIVAALFLVIALLKYSTRDRYRLNWFILSLFVLYLSIDEQAVLHEKLSKIFAGFSDLNGWLEYKWVIPGFVGVLVFAVLFIPFFLHLENRFKALFIVSTVMYFAGALGSEVFSGHYASQHGTKNIIYSLMTTVEEMLEFNGVNLLMYSLLYYIEFYFGDVRLVVGSRKSTDIGQSQKI